MKLIYLLPVLLMTASCFGDEPKHDSRDAIQQKKLKELAEKSERLRQERDDLQRKIAETEKQDVYQMRANGVRLSMLLHMPRSSAQALVSSSKDEKPKGQGKRTPIDSAIIRKEPRVEFERVK